MRLLVSIAVTLSYSLALLPQAPDAAATPAPAAAVAEDVEEPNANATAPPSDGTQTLAAWRALDLPDKPDPFRLSRLGRPWQQAARQRLKASRQRHRAAAVPHRTEAVAVRRRARGGLAIPPAAPALTPPAAAPAAPEPDPAPQLVANPP